MMFLIVLDHVIDHLGHITAFISPGVKEFCAKLVLGKHFHRLFEFRSSLSAFFEQLFR